MLIYQVKILKDNTTLEENNVVENSIMFVMLTVNKMGMCFQKPHLDIQRDIENVTLTTEKEVNAQSTGTMKFPVSPVVSVVVQCKGASDLSKLVDGLKRLRVAYTIAVSRKHLTAKAGELHLELPTKNKSL
ncbi:hypothetical protein MLD38_009553 [Melastoma candidum]|nr:hypothetical protein MLD38_009553 [Melastoma candidum]